MWNMNNLVMCCLKDSYKRCFILSDYYFEIKLQADRNYLLKRFFKFQMNLIFNELYILFNSDFNSVLSKYRICKG